MKSTRYSQQIDAGRVQFSLLGGELSEQAEALGSVYCAEATYSPEFRKIKSYLDALTHVTTYC